MNEIAADTKPVRKELDRIPNPNQPTWLSELPSDERLVYYVKGKGATEGKAFEVFFWNPQVDVRLFATEDAPLFDLNRRIKERYDVEDINAYLTMGTRGGIATKPAFQNGFDSDGNVDHARLQELADEWKSGRRATGGITKEVKELSKAVKDSGMDLAKIQALIARVKSGEISL